MIWIIPVRKILRSPAPPLAVMAALAMFSMSRKSPTYDEAVFVGSGIYYLRTLDHRVNAENPPLLKAFCALPSLVMRDSVPAPPPEAVYSYDMSVGFDYGNMVLYAEPNYAALLFVCRIMSVLMMVALGALVVVCARTAWGESTSLIVAWLFALSPNLLAHGRLLTPDMGCVLFFFLSTVLLWRMLNTLRWYDAALFGVVTGCALLTKYTAVLVAPISLLQLTLFICLRRKTIDWRRALMQFVTAWLIALAVIAVPYGGRGMFRALADDTYHSRLVRGMAHIPVLRALPLPVAQGFVRGFDIVAFQNNRDLPNIFWGRLYPHGGSWWYYYLVVLGLKTPIPLLILVTTGFCYLLRRRADHGRCLFFLVAPFTLFLNFSLLAERQLGLRYILPAWPYLLLLAGAAVHMSLTATDRRFRSGLGILTLSYALSSMATFPNYLTYFNILAGGSRNGWRYLAESNIDWGQDLPGLAAWQKQAGNPETLVLYYGTAPLEAWGVRSKAFGELPLPPYLAVSVTNYYLHEDFPLLQYLRKHSTPVASIGSSIHIYDTGINAVNAFFEHTQRGGK